MVLAGATEFVQAAKFYSMDGDCIPGLWKDMNAWCASGEILLL